MNRLLLRSMWVVTIALVGACDQAGTEPDLAVTAGALATDDGTVKSETREPVEATMVWWDGRWVTANRGDLVVQFREGTGLLGRWSAYTRIGGFPVYRSPDGTTFRVRVAADKMQSSLEMARTTPSITFVAPNAVLQGTGAKKPGSTTLKPATTTSTDGSNSTDPAAPWNSRGVWIEPPPDGGPSSATYYRYEWYAHREFARAAWQRTPALGAAVKVAVLDSGVSATPSLAEPRLLPGVDFIDPGWEPTDRNGHGTHMATIIAGSARVAGIAPAAQIVPVRVLDDNLQGTELALVEGLKWVASQPDIKVVNMSLAFPLDYYPSPLLLDAIDRVHQRGIVMVAASGNEGALQVAFPARLPQVIAVGAARMATSGTGVAFELAPYSNRSAVLDLVAFGGDLNRDVDKDLVVDGILGERPESPLGAAGVYLTAGTSPAAAQVAGAAALLLGQGAGASRVRPILQATTQPLAGSGRAFDGASGMGLLNVGQALDAFAAGYHATVAPDPKPLFAASALVLVGESDKPDSGVTSRSWIEVTDAADRPVVGALVFGHVDGATREDLMATTNGAGAASMKSTKFASQDAGFFAFSVDAVVDPLTGLPNRPHGLAKVEVQSFELFANLGVGLDATRVALAYDASALVPLNGINTERILPSYTLQTFGTGLISSATIFVVSPTYYQTSNLYKSSLTFTSYGTGLASSPIMLDPTFFSPTVDPPYGAETLQVRNVTAGTGLISSAVIWRGSTYGVSSFFVGRDPAILQTTTGTGLISSAVIFNQRSLSTTLSRTVDTTAWTTTGTGLISSAIVLPYSAKTVTSLGYSWETIDARYPFGTGLISSALVYLTNPYSTFRVPTTNIAMTAFGAEQATASW